MNPLNQYEEVKPSSMLACITIFSVLIFSQISSKHLFEAGYLSYTALFIAGVLSSGIIVVHFFTKTETISFNLIDLSFFAFVFCLLFRSLWSDNSWIYSKAAIGAVAVPIFIFVKNYKSINQIHCANIFTGVLQIIVCFLQKAGIVKNINNSFEVGGTVGNPNVLALILLFTIISAFYLLTHILNNQQ